MLFRRVIPRQLLLDGPPSFALAQIRSDTAETWASETLRIRPLNTLSIRIEVRDDRRGGSDLRFDRSSKEGSPRGGGPRIRCPRCGWEPERDSRWSCSCLHSWNTFDTEGRCPSCGRKWAETQCLRCHQWSPHREWYVENDEPGGLR